MTPQEVLDRAQEAQRLIEHPVLQEAFKGVREALVQRIESSAIGDAESHHSFAQQLQALNEIWRQLHRFVRDGEYQVAVANQRKQ